MEFVFDEAISMLQRYGCIGVMVDAKAGTVAFYERFGFATFAMRSGAIAGSSSTPMFLSIKALPGYAK